MTKIQKVVSLKNHSNFKIGGLASFFLEVKTEEDLVSGLKEWQQISHDFFENEKRTFVLGSGTNILFSDEGFSGLVIKNLISSITRDGDKVSVGGGTLVADLLNFCIENSLSGLEWAGGLPGTVGGAVRGNAGAYGGETKDNILEVESINLNTLEKKVRAKLACEFNYRSSIFKKGEGEDEIITRVLLSLTEGEKELIQKLTQEKIDARIKRHPLEYPNVGSIFKNVPVEKFTPEQMKELSQYIKDDPFAVIPTAKLNFLSGLLGKSVGGAMLSEKHTNFIINTGNAKASEVAELIKIIKEKVKEKFNVDLEEEVMFVS